MFGDVFEVRLKSHKKTLKETTHGRLVRVFNYYIRKIYVFNFILSKIKEIGRREDTFYGRMKVYEIDIEK